MLWLWQRLPVSGRVRSMLYWLLGAKYAVGVQALVFDAAGRVLLLRHTYKGHHPWGLPGGGMERDETAPQTALRELREEAGLHGTVVGLVALERHPSRLMLELFYLCHAQGGQFRPNAEISDYGYFALSALPPDLEPRLRHLLIRYAAAGLLPGAPNREL